MKYIKAYKLFESNKVDEFMYIVKDKLLELSDIGFRSYIEPKFVINSTYSIITVTNTVEPV